MRVRNFTIRQYLYEDGSVQFKIVPPKDADPFQSVEAFVDATALASVIAAEYDEDRTGQRTKRAVLMRLDQAIDANLSHGWRRTHTGL